ncbi:MAG: SUMF1/EgtB/PvdO family nonheme iron enzyme [Planctomycetes bacterium]|nr:SUMF1/EgtB/PvdO family nonheme iron enzyme [Planctomycetota bacterium]
MPDGVVDACLVCRTPVPPEVEACPACRTPVPRAKSARLGRGPSPPGPAPASAPPPSQPPPAPAGSSLATPPTAIPLGTAGGFGEVYRVHHRVLRCDLALKTLHPGLVPDPNIRERFFREARILMGLIHANLVPMREVGEWQGRLYLTMDLCPGETLSALLKRRGRLPAREAARLALPILCALEYAHGKGIVHRDLKPLNLIVSEGSTGGWDVKVLDFGVAKILHEGGPMDNEGPSLTATGAMIGTLAYMSPEQAQGLEIDARSDLFSMGAVLYQAVTGRRPFEGRTPRETVMKVLLHAPPPFEEAGVTDGDLPGLEALILRALAKEPAERPASARDFRHELERLLGGGRRAGSTPVGPISETIDRATRPTVPEVATGGLSSGPGDRASAGLPPVGAPGPTARRGEADGYAATADRATGPTGGAMKSRPTDSAGPASVGASGRGATGLGDSRGTSPSKVTAFEAGPESAPARAPGRPRLAQIAPLASTAVVLGLVAAIWLRPEWFGIGTRPSGPSGGGPTSPQPGTSSVRPTIPADRSTPPVGASPPTAEPAAEAEYREALRLGEEALSGRDFDGADRHFAEALAEKAGDPKATDAASRANRARTEAARRARYDGFMEAGRSAREQRAWSGAERSYQDAAKEAANPAESQAAQSAIDACRGAEAEALRVEQERAATERKRVEEEARQATEKKYLAAMKAGEEALGIRDYDRADERFADALAAKPWDGNATEAASRVKSARAEALRAGAARVEAARLEEARRRKEREEASRRAGGSLSMAGLTFLQKNAQGCEEYRHEKTGITLVLVLAPDRAPVEFDMGSPKEEEGRFADEEPHRVRLTQPFLLGKTELTNAQHRRSWQSHDSDAGSLQSLNGDQQPAVNVSWEDADGYCRSVGLRLPSEAEWEYAARGGDRRVFPWGNEWPPPRGAGNFADETAGKAFSGWTILQGYDDGFAVTAPVGRFGSSRLDPFGLQDMAGNVSEFCADWSAPYETGRVVPDPHGPQNGKDRVVRGGSWHCDDRRTLRCAFRNWLHAPYARFGWRVALSAGTK